MTQAQVEGEDPLDPVIGKDRTADATLPIGHQDELAAHDRDGLALGPAVEDGAGAV